MPPIAFTTEKDNPELQTITSGAKPSRAFRMGIIRLTRGFSIVELDSKRLSLGLHSLKSTFTLPCRTDATEKFGRYVLLYRTMEG